MDCFRARGSLGYQVPAIGDGRRSFIVSNVCAFLIVAQDVAQGGENSPHCRALDKRTNVLYDECERMFYSWIEWRSQGDASFSAIVGPASRQSGGGTGFLIAAIAHPGWRSEKGMDTSGSREGWDLCIRFGMDLASYHLKWER